MVEGGRVVEDEDKDEGDAEAESSEDAGQTVGEESFEGLGDEDDEEGPESVKPGKAQQSRLMKEIGGPVVALTARQRAMQTSKDVDRESAPSLIEYPEGLTNPLSRSMFYKPMICSYASFGCGLVNLFGVHVIKLVCGR